MPSTELGDVDRPQAPREAVSAAAFFQAWPPTPYTADVTALAAAPGVDGGLLALSALERSPLARVLLTGLPALGGFQAAYAGAHPRSWSRVWKWNRYLCPSPALVLLCFGTVKGCQCTCILTPHDFASPESSESRLWFALCRLAHSTEQIIWIARQL